jgi:hypothetical protein
MAQEQRETRPAPRVTSRTYRGWKIETQTLRPFADWERHTVWSPDWKVNHHSFATGEEAEAYVDGIVEALKGG